MVPYLDGALRRDLPRVAEVVLADLGAAAAEKADPDAAAAEEAKTKVEELQALEAQILRDFETLCAGLATPEQIAWLNQDANYKKAVGDVIGFRQAGLTRLVKVRGFFPNALHSCAREPPAPRLIRVCMAGGLEKLRR